MKKIFGYLFLVFLAYLMWEILSFVYLALKQSNATMTAILAAIITATGGIIAILITQQKTKQREIDEAHRSKKIEIYKDFIDTVVHATIIN